MEIFRLGKELGLILWEMWDFKPVRDPIGSMHFTMGALATVWEKGQEREARMDEDRPVRSPRHGQVGDGGERGRSTRRKESSWILNRFQK